MSELVRDAASHRARRGTVHAVIEALHEALAASRSADSLRIARDIVAALLDVPRSWPLLNPEFVLEAATAEKAHAALRLIAQGAPFAYAVGSAHFRHLRLKVDERVLIPRPETESLVSEILDRMNEKRPAKTWGTAIDIGTGSGAIALALASEGRFDRVIGTDASGDALDVARINRDTLSTVLRTSVELRQGSFTAPVGMEMARVVVSNPPYVAFSEIDALPAIVRDWEPPIALLSGHDGLAATRTIVTNAAEILERGGLLALETDERRASLVSEMIMSDGRYEAVTMRLDLTGRERFVLASRI